MTKAGAGGEIHAALLESLEERGEGSMTFVEALMTDEVRGFIRSIARDVAAPAQSRAVVEAARTKAAGQRAHELRESLTPQLPDRRTPRQKLMDDLLRVGGTSERTLSEASEARSPAAEPVPKWEAHLRRRGVGDVTIKALGGGR